jgi:hypothetical protein
MAKKSRREQVKTWKLTGKNATGKKTDMESSWEVT